MIHFVVLFGEAINAHKGCSKKITKKAIIKIKIVINQVLVANICDGVNEDHLHHHLDVDEDTIEEGKQFVWQNKSCYGLQNCVPKVDIVNVFGWHQINSLLNNSLFSLLKRSKS